MFSQLKQAIQANYESLVKDNPNIFYKDVDRDKIWDVYLNAYPSETRQEHNCNNCKSFLRQYSGITFIVGYKPVSIWDIDTDLIDEEYRTSIIAVKDYITSLPITNVFLTETKKIGTASNIDRIKNTTWEHLSLNLGNIQTTDIKDIDSKKGLTRTAKEVLKRALEELTSDAIENVIELIAQNSIYRGREFEGAVTGFNFFKAQYDELSNDEKDCFAWSVSLSNPNVTGIRNSAIGTLLVNLSEGMDLDTAVRKYESVVAPANYKRPTSLITPKMIEAAKEKINELGYLDSLYRRHAVATDLNVNDILFTDRSWGISDVFGELAKDTLVNPKTLSKVEGVSITDFIEKILPTIKSVDVLLENRHLSNLVTLLTAEHPNALSMFKWSNQFSWDYTGGIADSMKERVKAAGGNVDGVLRFSIQWNDEDTKASVDFDAHAYEPGGAHIYYSSGYRKDQGNVKTGMTGQLDVDMIRPSDIGVENISWTDISKMNDGDYKFVIHNYDGGRTTGFKAQIEADGEIHDFYYPTHVNGYLDVATVTLKEGVFTVKPALDSNTKISAKQKWGVKTNQFTKVSTIMLSPNHWQQQVGNKHFFFILDGCVTDETVRPFFNEFLKQDLNDHRKVFEVMAGKLKVPKSTNQLSGIGFSETQDNSLIVQVTGSFKRNLKIKF